MGPCLYTPERKQCYIPINHRDYHTGALLPNQLTEQDIEEELLRVKQAGTKVVMHEAKFDIKIIKMTCNVPLQAYWDTLIVARLIDENERSVNLKNQYIDKIDASQEKYSIGHLFENIPYEWVDPDIFCAICRY